MKAGRRRTIEGRACCYVVFVESLPHILHSNDMLSGF